MGDSSILQNLEPSRAPKLEFPLLMDLTQEICFEGVIYVSNFIEWTGIRK